MQRSIATSPSEQTGGAPSIGARIEALRRTIEQADPALVGLFFVVLAVGIYVFSHPTRNGLYDHFVWQAEAYLDGRLAIRYPVESGPFVNAYFQDVMPLPTASEGSSLGLLPFPPLPALLLVPFVAVFGLATDAQLVGAVLGALNVGLAWRMLVRVTDDRGAAFLAALFFAFGTVHWYAAMLSSTWFLAHVVATTFLLLGISLALDGERREAVRRLLGGAAARRLNGRIDGLQFMAGFVFGLAALARLPILLGAPFFVFVGGGGGYFRRALSAGIGAFIPFALLLTYNLAASGHVFNPAYEWLYQTEYLGYLPPGMEINREWMIEDARFIPMNSRIMFAWPPIIQPECGLSLLNRDCPLIKPDQIGMSIVLTSPAYLLALPFVVRAWRRRLVAGATLAVVAIALLNLAHFSQGWVQFGYRFSNDFAPFALILVALAIAWLGIRRLTVALVALSIVVNAWGVYWGVVLGW